MLLNRTIRRTMLIGMTLVSVMLLTLSIGGILSLFSYKHVVAELENSFDDRVARDKLCHTVVGLNEFLRELEPIPVNRPFALQEFHRQLDNLDAQLNDYKRNLDQLPPDPETAQARLLGTQSVVNSIIPTVNRLRNHRWLSNLKFADAQEQGESQLAFLREVEWLQLQVRDIPDFNAGPHETVDHAKNAYHTGFWLIGGSSGVVLLLFFSLVWYLRHCVLVPLQRLHQGALRVAQGDFDYRLTLPSPEEMSELAEAFNNMTDRFQEIRDGLDQQVRDKFRQLVRSERLAGIGFLAAGVAHEINNPLQAIAIAAESLETRIPEPNNEAEEKDVEVIRQYLGMIQREAFRCQQITRKLLEFSRGNGEARGRHDLTAIVNEVLALIRPMGKYRDRNIQFDRTAPCVVDVNGPEIQQVVLNLVSNALEAMQGGGTLAIRIVEQAGQVVLEFVDDGCGMTPEVLENLFEPFFTQRKDGRGTGLGLSISNRIIADHGGTIDATSDGPGCGSTVRVILPWNSFRAGTAA